MSKGESEPREHEEGSLGEALESAVRPSLDHESSEPEPLPDLPRVDSSELKVSSFILEDLAGRKVGAVFGIVVPMNSSD